MGAECEQLTRRRTELVLELFAPQEIAMQRIVEVDTQPAVQVLARVQRTHTAVTDPKLGDRDLLLGRPVDRQPPGRLKCGEAHHLGVDVGFSRALAAGLYRR